MLLTLPALASLAEKEWQNDHKRLWLVFRLNPHTDLSILEWDKKNEAGRWPKFVGVSEDDFFSPHTCWWRRVT